MGTVVLGRMPNGDFGAENQKGELVSFLDVNTMRQPQQSVNQGWFNNGGFNEVAANQALAQLDFAPSTNPSAFKV